ncbi:MAG: fumarylacetoacetate hydrolase family protein [Bacteroidota bacterium]
MGCYIARYQWDDAPGWAVVLADRLIPLHNTAATLADFLETGLEEARNAASAPPESGLALKDVRFLSPVTAPARIMCQELSYTSDEDEEDKKSKEPPEPVFVRKDESSLNGANGIVKRPAGARLLDYGIELGLIIRCHIYQPVTITAENLHQYVAGLVMANDISARDLMLQTPFRQWYRGKGCRTLCPIGPFFYLWDKEDVPLINNLDLKLWVNEELRQNANTAQLGIGPAQTLSRLSEFINLAPGDCVLTGTPAGIAISTPGKAVRAIGSLLLSEKQQLKLFIDKQAQNPEYLQDGDQIRATIASPDGRIDLGTQNCVVH